MLNIGKLGAGGEAYYLESVASGAEDYYVHAREAPGTWLGSAARDLGLVGLVEPEALRAVLGAADPGSDAPLGPSPSRKVPGFDLTFRAPKSVSVLHGLGERTVAEEVRRAHDAAVLAALSYLEGVAAWSRRGAQGRESVRVGGFVAAGFRHRTSRAGDPLLHTHVVVSNLGRAVDDGRWRTLDARPLYLHAKTAGFVYQAHLRHELTRRLGVEWGPVRNGCAELAGMPRRVLRLFSRRRAEIEQQLTERGETSAKAAQAAALDTRRAKEYAVAGSHLETQWRARAAAEGFTRAELVALLGRQAVPALTAEQAVALAEELAGPSGLTERSSTFVRRDVVRAWCERIPAGADAAHVAALTDAMLDADRGLVVRLLEPGGVTAGDVVRRSDGRAVRAGDEPRYSTPELLALEQHTLDGAVARRDEGVAVVSPAQVRAVLTRRRGLSHEQRAMVRALTTEGSGVAVVVGKAGSGKTFALDAAREVWQAAGLRVVGCALAARAAAVLEDGTGIPSTTLDALLAELDRPGGGLAPGSVVVVDEAAMVGTRRLARLLDRAAAARAKVVLVGDHRQLPEIDAGGVFRGLAVRLGAVELTHNHRQDEPWERHALDQLRRGDTTAAVAAFDAHGRITTAPTAEQIRDRLVNDWWHAHDGARAGDVGIMIAARRVDVDDLNARARHRLRDAGLLTGPTLTADGREFAVGDRVLCTRNDRWLGVLNGDLATVTAVDVDARTLTLRRERDNTNVEVPSRYLDADHLAHAYALTAHKAQGATVERAWVLGSHAAYREWAYVALSRARAGSRLYLVGDADGTSNGFADAIERSRAQSLALDHGEPAQHRVPSHGHEGRIAATERQLARHDEALRHARDAGNATQEQLMAACAELDERSPGLRRFMHSEEATRLRTAIARLEGDLAAWTDRIDYHTAERAALLERYNALTAASPPTAEPRTRDRAARLPAPAPLQGELGRHVRADQDNVWDIGIA